MSEKYKFLDKMFKEELSENDYGRLGKNISLMLKNGLPALPSIIISIEQSKKLYEEQFMRDLKGYIDKLKTHLIKELGDNKTAVINLVTSSSMANIPNIQIQNIGLNVKSVSSFVEHFGEEKTFLMFQTLVSDIFYFKNGLKKTLTVDNTTLIFLKEILDSNQQGSLPEDDFNFLKGFYKASTIEDIVKYLETADAYYLDNYFSSTLVQLESVLREISSYLATNDDLSSIILQPVIHGHFNVNSYRGYLYTNDLITGVTTINGRYVQEMAKYYEGKSKDLKNISKQVFDDLSKLSHDVRHVFKDIMKVLFLVENNNVWLLDIYDVENCSFQADLNDKLDLYENKIITDKELIEGVSLAGLTQLMHPVIDRRQAEGVQNVVGGIVGAPGAATGKVYFSADALLEAYELSVKKGVKEGFILAMPHTFADEVKAIKVGDGVISSFGGYASHAPVVCRSLHKVSMVENSIKWGDKQMELFGMVVKEGDHITLNAEVGKSPEVFNGAIPLIEPDFEKNNLTRLLDVTSRYSSLIKVYTNVDEPDEARQSLIFKAEGIGLCRTEHMFFDEKRLVPFLEMILTKKSQNKKKALKIIEAFQTEDFYNLFKVFGNKPVTVRLLDAPLHEFIPKDKDKLDALIEHMVTHFSDIDAETIRTRCEMLKEFNPMLGNRGCRLSILSPEIYHMQTRAIMNAACKLKKENNITAQPKIMVPLIGLQKEMRFIKDGKVIEGENIVGIRHIAEEVLETQSLKGKIEYQIGCMIELPSAALASGDLAHVSEFFSFGTNDLTQTTFGLSRDDTTELLSEYTKYDIVEDNPFAVLQNRVKELIEISSRRGKTIRPDLKLSLCGEHGADPQNIKFLIDQKIDIVSCSPYSIPVVKLVVAKEEIKQTK